MPPRLGALLAILFWGISFVATKAAVAELDPFTLVFARSALGALLLIGILAGRGEPVLPPRDTWRALALMGFVGVAFHQALQGLGPDADLRCQHRLADRPDADLVGAAVGAHVDGKQLFHGMRAQPIIALSIDAAAARP